MTVQLVTVQKSFFLLPVLEWSWVLKGSTCIKKCHLEVALKLLSDLGLDFLLCPSSNLIENHTRNWFLLRLVVVRLLSQGRRNVLTLRISMDVSKVDFFTVHCQWYWVSQLLLPVIKGNYHICGALAWFESFLILLLLTKDQLVRHRSRISSLRSVSLLGASVYIFTRIPKILSAGLSLTLIVFDSVGFCRLIVRKVHSHTWTYQSKRSRNCSKHFAGKWVLLGLFSWFILDWVLGQRCT